MSLERPQVALVDDDQVMSESLRQRLTLEGYEVTWWQSGAEALVGLDRVRPDLLLCDIRLPDMNGEDIFRHLTRRAKAPPVIFLTAYGEIDQAVRLMREGASDYLTKPFAIDELLSRLDRLMAPQSQGALGASPAMAAIEQTLGRIADVDTPVLLTGETGVGKEVAARFLHDAGRARRGPFVAVNCAAIPADLLESEIFGHERGAFTGAERRHEGYAERAGEGTLFLDEVADLTPALQAKLLRLLQERSFHRVGGEQALPFRARVVSASNADLGSLVATGRFRSDLLYRINVIPLVIPPLRERPEDVPLLLTRFLALFRDTLGRDVGGIVPLAEEAALTHDWPGNVRELRNRVERAVALARGPSITAQDLFPELGVQAADDRLATLSEVRAAAERRQIRRALAETGGQQAKAAELLGISRTTLWEKLRRLGLDEAGRG